ncbi:MAG: hypothetical protein V1918_00260 [Planctomycetota bacterium]
MPRIDRTLVVLAVLLAAGAVGILLLFDRGGVAERFADTPYGPPPGESGAPAAGEKGPASSARSRPIRGDFNLDGTLSPEDETASVEAFIGRASYLRNHLGLAEADFAFLSDLDRNGAFDQTDLEILSAALAEIRRASRMEAAALPGSQAGSAASGGAILRPGTGFPVAAAEPPLPQGPAPGPTAMARWDVVPFQTFDLVFTIGAVAFHAEGIDRVEFSLEGGPWTAVRESSHHERTRVREYWALLRAGDLPDGPFEVRAVAYPRAGRPRALPPLRLNANAHGSLLELERHVSLTGSDERGDGSFGRPFATLMRAAHAVQEAAGSADGGILRLGKGEHVFGTYATALEAVTRDRWLTIAPERGVEPKDIRLAAPGNSDGLRTARVRVVGVHVAPKGGAPLFSSNEPLEDALWLDRCAIDGPGRTAAYQWTSGWSEVYVTDCVLSGASDGLKADLQRNVLVSGIGSDAFSDSGLVVNCRATGIDRTGTDFHPDVVQFYGRRENLIVYGLEATRMIEAQGIFAGALVSLQDVALVNCRIDNQTLRSPFKVFQFGGPVDHLLVKDCSFTGPAAWRVDQGFTAANVVVEDTVFAPDPAPVPAEVPGVTYRRTRPAEEGTALP